MTDAKNCYGRWTNFGFDLLTYVNFQYTGGYMGLLCGKTLLLTNYKTCDIGSLHINCWYCKEQENITQEN